MLGLFALMAAHLMVAQPPVTQPLDDAWRAWVGADGPVGGPLFWFFEQFGYGLGYALLAGVSLLLLAGGRWWTVVFVLSAALLGPGLVSQGTKQLVDRPRPAPDPARGLHGPWVAVDHGSFPSGHALTMGFAVVAVGVLLPAVHRRWWTPASVLLCGGMVWQRTWVNAHWLSDAVFGVLAGVAATMVVAWLLHDRVAAEQAGGWRWVWRPGGATSPPLR